MSKVSFPKTDLKTGSRPEPKGIENPLLIAIDPRLFFAFLFEETSNGFEDEVFLFEDGEIFDFD